MASASEVANVAIELQMEASRLESQIVAGDVADFTVLQDLVSAFKDVASLKSVDSDAPKVVVPTD